MPGNDRSRPGESGSEKTMSAVNTMIPTAADNLPGCAVVMITKYGMPRRKVYLDLGHARAAVARIRGRGGAAWLVLAELKPVQADLDGEVAE